MSPKASGRRPSISRTTPNTAGLACWCSPALAVPLRSLASTSELRDKPRLLILSERAGNLTHHHARGIAGVCKVITVRREHPHVALDEQEHAKLLGNKVAGEPAGVLHHHRAHAIAFVSRLSRWAASAGATQRKCGRALTELDGRYLLMSLQSGINRQRCDGQCSANGMNSSLLR
jgi:hypothetical protein